MSDQNSRLTAAQGGAGTRAHRDAARPANRRKRPTNRERNDAARIGSGARSMTRSLGKRAGAGEVEALSELRAIKREAHDALKAGARAGVEAGHFTWSEVARELGITKQAAHKTYGEHQ